MISFLGLVVMTKRGCGECADRLYNEGHDAGVERGYGCRKIADEAESRNRGYILCARAKKDILDIAQKKGL